jgi:hypothetical protein
MIDHILLIELLKNGLEETTFYLLQDRINFISSDVERHYCQIILKYVDNIDSLYFLNKDFSLSLIID